MWKRVVAATPWRTVARRHSTSVSSAIDSILLRSLKDHYLEVSKMSPPPKVNPPSPFSIVKGALENSGPVLRRSYGEEEIKLSVTRLPNLVNGNDGEDEDEDGGEINQLFLHVEISKPDLVDSLHFLCGLYPDAMGIHAVNMRPKLEFHSQVLTAQPKYHGRGFQDLEEKIKDGLHRYIEERGVNESLFRFLQAWLYVKDHRNLMRWFKTVGTFIKEQKVA